MIGLILIRKLNDDYMVLAFTYYLLHLHTTRYIHVLIHISYLFVPRYSKVDGICVHSWPCRSDLYSCVRDTVQSSLFNT